jgi:hypothetical protein
MRLPVAVSGVYRAAWCTNQKDSFPKFTGIPEHTAAIKRSVYVKPAVRDVDPQGAEGKPLSAEDEAREPGRSQRVELQIPVLIYVQMPDGRSLRHDGFTLLVNIHGCVFTMETKLEVGQRIVLANPKSGIEQSGIVTRVQKSRDGGYAVAFEFDNSTPQLWSLMFLTKDAKVERF